MEVISLSIGFILLCILVGMWNQKRGNSFWVAFILSILLSPFIGAIIVAITSPNVQKLVQNNSSS